MKKISKSWLFFILCMSMMFYKLQAELVVTLFVKPAMPDKSSYINLEKMRVLLRTPGQLNLKILKQYFKTGTYDGVIATYMGQLAVSSFIGKITFERQQKNPEFNILITPMIEPIMMIGTTVHHWETIENVPAQMYSVERKQDPETNVYYWQTQKTNIPENKIISLDTIVIFAKPNNIFMNEGITITNNNPQFVLPSLYAKKELNIPANAIRVLKIRHFFGPIWKIIKKLRNTYYADHIIN